MSSARPTGPRHRGEVRFDFSGARVLITGASRGIGLGAARGFAASGAELILLAEDSQVTTAAKALSADAPGGVRAIVCDVRDSGALREAAEALESLDVLISNAGVELRTPVSAASETVDSHFELVTSVNLQGSWNVLRAFLPLMGAGGRIVMTSSIWGKTGQAEFGAYSASKHAIIGLVRSLAPELGSKGISINAVCPGWVRTQAALRSLEAIAATEDRSADSMLEDILGAQALPGLMEPGDMADIFQFLGSEAARNITGQAFTVDRGETCI